MENKEKGAYVLGTDAAELHRLGFQHQVWASEAHQGWETANFTYGNTILDLGCGPGFVTKELAYLVGPEGKVIGVDKSEVYLNHLNQIALDHQLENIELHHKDFIEMELPAASVDHIYHRWALAWISEVDDIVSKMVSYLRPGGTIVSHEYFDWATLQLEPEVEEWKIAKDATLESFKAGGGNINIGRQLPQIFESHGLKIESIRPMTKMSRSDSLAFNWPATFFEIYFPKVAEMGFMPKDLCERVLQRIKVRKKEEKTILYTPTMIEVIARKV